MNSLVLFLALAAMLASAPATAKKPSSAGDSQKGNSQNAERRDYFEERHRVIVRDYYGEEHRAGRCPPGLAKKHNGCMPPGQARKWQIGQPLPRDVVYHAVPQPVAAQLGQPPSGYRYIRVASDILLMALGNGTIVDAIKNLGRT